MLRKVCKVQHLTGYGKGVTYLRFSCSEFAKYLGYRAGFDTAL